jgi:hypothetical protein
MGHLDCIKNLQKITLWSTIQISIFFNFKKIIYEDGKKKCAWNMDGDAWTSFIRWNVDNDGWNI